MIKPTVGRVVWYRDPSDDRSQPNAAIVAYVHSDYCVNLVVFDSNGIYRSQTSVHLHQGDEAKPLGPYAEWMPYQQGQAAKAEALEKELQSKS